MDSKNYRKKAIPIRTRYDRQATEQRILSTCVKLFLEQGFSNTPPKQIFEEADVSAGTFYHLYKAKSDVLREFIGFMFTNQFGIARKIIGKDASPVMLYAVETSIQLALTELNENLRDIYLEAYSHTEATEYIYQHTSNELYRIFGPYLPSYTESDFYELEIGSAGIMRGYMSRPCDKYFTLEKKLARFLSMSLNAYAVPAAEQKQVLDFIAKLDIRAIAVQVMQELFKALAMRFSFPLPDSVKA